ncbi:MAG TPA: helix-turn-helix transcriptional regulator [Saprospiraceae bacterium]|nr:helix-turn-helix transcriptional regulator [Saprospiraceae bacterium]
MEEKNSQIDYNILLATIASNVKKYRLAKGWSQEDLAYSADIDRTYIGYIENAKHNISIKKLCQICNALNVNLEDLLLPSQS